MSQGSIVTYLRVSTARQGKSGLGLEAQQKAVADYLSTGQWNLLEEFVEVESGKNSKRPKLLGGHRTLQGVRSKTTCGKVGSSGS